MISVDIQLYHQPPFFSLSIAWDRYHSLVPARFSAVLRIVAILLGSSPSHLMCVVFAILTVGNSSSFCTRAGSWGVRRV